MLLGLTLVVVLGAGCRSAYDQQRTDTSDAHPPSDHTQTRSPDASLSTVPQEQRQRIAEERLRLFIAALDRGDAAAARALLSRQQRRDTEFLDALPPDQLRAFADWYRTYRFAAMWEDRAEFRPTQEMPGVSTRSLYVQFAPSKKESSSRNTRRER